MARPFPTALILPLHHNLLFAFLAILVAVISTLSAVTFLCGSHSGWGRPGKTAVVRLGGDGNRRRRIEKMRSSLSSKALLMAKMISWRKVQDEGEAEDYSPLEEGTDDEEDDVVWKKAIIKGEKCRPIDFSGKILYDCDGNRLPD